MESRQPIQTMPADLAQKIAAGEVVERPASAVKELLDNAIDAGATSIKTEIREGGLKLIRVTDDGCGIPRSELDLAFTSHATNKIRSLEDLEHLETLGFRGEALPSIASVARVEVLTKAQEEPAATRYLIEYGKPLEEAVASGAPGTRVLVRDLFSNVPARQKFVRSLRAEGGRIGNLVKQYALAQPSIRFSFLVEERSLFESPGNGLLQDAMAAVYGPEIVDLLCDVEAHDQDIAVSGLISSPALSRPNRSDILIIVNGRPVENRSLTFALSEAYTGYLMTGRYPIAAIHLKLPAAQVDANIHPTKSQVRFARERDVHGILHRAVSDRLLEARPQARTVDGAVASRPEDQSEQEQSSLFSKPEATRMEMPSLVPNLPSLRVFGQTNQTFIIAEGPQGLYMIDQHAAHERILFDRLDQQMADGPTPSQPLLEPASLELTAAQVEALETNDALLREVGFAVEPFGHSSCLIRSVPALNGLGSPTDLVTEVLSELQNLPEPKEAKERAMAAVSCQAAVKAGQVLDVKEMSEIVLQLERTECPSTCPHGRPTMVHLSHSRLEREFGRR